MKFSSYNLGGLGLVGLLAIIVLESVCRRNVNYNASLLRPTVMIETLNDKGEDVLNYCLDLSQHFWKFLGTQLARLTDLYYLLQEYFPWEDMCNLAHAVSDLVSSWAYYVWGLVVSPLKFLRGYFDYFYVGYTGEAWSTYLVSSVLVIALVVLGSSYFMPVAYSVKFYALMDGFNTWIRNIPVFLEGNLK